MLPPLHALLRFSCAFSVARWIEDPSGLPSVDIFVYVPVPLTILLPAYAATHNPARTTAPSTNLMTNRSICFSNIFILHSARLEHPERASCSFRPIFFSAALPNRIARCHTTAVTGDAAPSARCGWGPYPATGGQRAGKGTHGKMGPVKGGPTARCLLPGFTASGRRGTSISIPK